MHDRIRSASFVTALCLTSAFGCSTPKPEPEIASSASQGGYAESYPNELQGAATAFSQDEAKIKETSGKYPGYSRDLKGPGKPYADEVYAKADASGRSQAYVDALRETRETKKFMDRDGEEITKKAAGAANYAAKQKGCDVDVSGAVMHAFKESMDKQLEKRLRDANEGYQVVDRNREILKEDAAVLEKQADEVAYASYLAHIDIVEQKLRVRRMVEEAETVKKTADAYIEEEREFQKKSGRTDAEKKASEQRIAEMQKAKANIDSSVQQAKGLSDVMDDRITQIQKDYDDALKQLKDAAANEG